MIIYIIQKTGGNNNSPNSLNVMVNYHYHGGNRVITSNYHICLKMEYSLYLDTLRCCLCIIVTLLVADDSHEAFVHNHLSCLSYTG